MAKILKQIVTQDNLSGPLGLVPKRIIVQWEDTVADEDDQIILDYDAMTTEQKAIYDSFVQMSTDVMNA